MLNFIETILVKIFSLLPDANPNDSAVNAVNNAFNFINPTLAKIDLIFYKNLSILTNIIYSP